MLKKRKHTEIVQVALSRIHRNKSLDVTTSNQQWAERDDTTVSSRSIQRDVQDLLLHLKMQTKLNLKRAIETVRVFLTQNKEFANAIACEQSQNEKMNGRIFDNLKLAMESYLEVPGR